MNEISRLLDANEGFAAARANIDDPRPSRRLAIVTCMDARIDVFATFGLHLGEAHVIRNAGGRISEDVMRSLTLSSHLLGVEVVVIVQHTKCGLAGVTDEELRDLTGAEIAFYPIHDHASTLGEDIERLAVNSSLAPIKTIGGFVYDVETGRVEELVRWAREHE
ncbi:MAG TPA: carbonic anhydrase [Acidimicrobiales bacterium]|nr:carbonic anhydrase [Acidimicrobiales bacterium]